MPEQIVTAWIRPMNPTVKIIVAIITSTKVNPAIKRGSEADFLKSGGAEDFGLELIARLRPDKSLSGQRRVVEAPAQEVP